MKLNRTVSLLLVALAIFLGGCAQDVGAPSTSEGESWGKADGVFGGGSCYRSPLGYDLQAPYQQLTPEEQSAFVGLPLDSVGAVIVEEAPFRGTATYLGEFDGVHLALTSRHVTFAKRIDPDTGEVVDVYKNAVAIEFGQASETNWESPVNTFSVPVAKMLFTTEPGDATILALEPHERLNELVPVPVEATSIEALIAGLGDDARFVTVGRGWQAHPAIDAAADAYRDVWSDCALDAYDDAAAEAAASATGANGTPLDRGGDVTMVAETTILARGRAQPLRDPDGLGTGPGPFLAVPADWAPTSFALTAWPIGRSSGAPVFHVSDDGQASIVGVVWTRGVPEDIRPYRQQADHPSMAFGRIEERIDAEGNSYLEAVEPAPLGYAAAATRMLEDLTIAVQGPDLSPKDREVLSELARQIGVLL